MAFAAQQWFGSHGFERVVNLSRADELIYVGRLLPGGTVPGMEGVHRAPRREVGSGVLAGVEQTGGSAADLAADLKKLAEANHISIEADYSAAVIPASYSRAPQFPQKWVHLGVATAWADTPAEAIDMGDMQKLERMLELYVQGTTTTVRVTIENRASSTVPLESETPPNTTGILKTLIAWYGVSRHEEAVRDEIKHLLPQWAKPEVDSEGNLIVRVGTSSAGSKADRILLIAHMDETGVSEVKSITARWAT